MGSAFRAPFRGKRVKSVFFETCGQPPEKEEEKRKNFKELHFSLSYLKFKNMLYFFLEINMENQMNVGNQNAQQIGQNPVSQPVITPEKPKINYLLVGGIILTSFVVFGFGGFYLGQQSSNSQTYMNNNQNRLTPTATPEVNVPTTSPTSIIDPASNWTSYADSLYKFSFKYPNDWQANCTKPQDDTWLSRNICDLRAPGTNLDHGQLISGAYIVVGVNKPDPNYSNLEEYVQFSVKQDKYNSAARTINNINGYQLTSQSNSAFVFERNGHFIVISWIPLTESNSYFSAVNQILSTFRLSI